MSQVPKLCNDMMNLGRLQGYEVRSLPVHSVHLFITANDLKTLLK